MARLSKPNREQRRIAQALEQGYQVVAAQQMTLQEISGPIPSPDLLRQYEEIQPGLADRIVKTAEEESLHRRELEKISIGAQARDIASQRSEIRAGQFAALVVAISGFVCGTYAMTHGSQIGGSCLSGGTLISLVGAFLYRHNIPDKPKAAEGARPPIAAQSNALVQK
jgi:uncharacterized membrane protein